MKKAIFFDLDGTLRNAIDPLMESYNNTMKKHNLSYRFDVKTMESFMGLTPIETAKLLFKDVDIKTGLKYFYFCLNDELIYLKNHPGKLYNDEEKVLQKLSKEYDLYVLSNAEKNYIENYLNAYNFNKYFKGHLCAGDTGLDKASNIKYLMNKEKINDVIYVGDTEKDMIECQKANVEFIHAAYGFGFIKEVKYKIESLNELYDLVKKIFRD